MTTKSLSDARKNLEITPPRIPESIFDGPSQRLLLFSGVAALQAYKLTKTFNLWTSDSSTRILDSEIALYRWALVDLSAVLVIWWLRIPRLRFQKSVWLAIIALLFTFNWLLLGSWKVCKNYHPLTLSYTLTVAPCTIVYCYYTNNIEKCIHILQGSRGT